MNSFRLSLSSDGVYMSSDEFDGIDREDCEPGYDYELVRNVVSVRPIPSDAVADANEELGCLLRQHQRTSPLGQILDRTLANRYLFLSCGTRRLVGRVLWCELGRLPRPRIDVPSIVVDFHSRSVGDSTNSFVEKQREYTASEVKEYWIIDHAKRILIVFLDDGSRFEIGETEPYKSALLPGFQVPLKALFDLMDEWDDEAR